VNRRALLFAVVFMCGCHPPRSHQTLPADGNDNNDEMPEVIATPGEQMTYRISLHGLDVAEFTVAIGADTQVEGVETVVVQTHAVSSLLLTMFHPVDDTLASWIDRATGRPVAFAAHELASSKSNAVEDTEVRFAPGKFLVSVIRDGQHFDEDQVVQYDAYDVPSMLTLVRGWRAAAGAKIVVDVMRSRTAWRVQLAVGASEGLTTAIGDLQAVRYDGSGVRILRNGQDDPSSDRRKFSMWISDDSDRVPLRLTAHTDYGDIKMDLVDYRAQ
jgi:Protein of unknown function (DUF3108)